jgi:hypothetical protein
MPFINTPYGKLQIQDPPTSPIKFSRLFGYRGLTPVPEEQAVIRKVVETIASSSEPIEQVIAELVEELNSSGKRRSGKRWLRSTVIALVRPVYGGRIGTMVSQLYPELIPWATVVKAMERVK